MIEAGGKSDEFESAYAGSIDFSPINSAAASSVTRDDQQARQRAMLADTFYGPIPPPPDKLSVVREPMQSERAERLQIKVSICDRAMNVDAALWLPSKASGPVPLICGLDFIGPVGLMSSPEFPIDKSARVSSRADYGASDNRIEETLRGVCAYRWPVGMLLDAGFAVLVSCYGSWVPDDIDHWNQHGLYPLLVNPDKTSLDNPDVKKNSSQHHTAGETHTTGAISLWAWAIQRLLDVAATCDEIDMSRVCVAGHSRLGKAALWAAANDSRISAVFANQSGCGGSAPAAHPVGETLAQMHERFPHWLLPPQQAVSSELRCDQHHLLSLIAPRALYLGGARSDLWSDPIGSYLALAAAAPMWDTDSSQGRVWPSARELWQSSDQVCNGALGYHLRPGGHDLLPFDWRQFLQFQATL